MKYFIAIFLSISFCLCFSDTNPAISKLKTYEFGEFVRLSIDDQVKYINSLSTEGRIVFFKDILSKFGYTSLPLTGITFQKDGVMILMNDGQNIPMKWEWKCEKKKIIFKKPKGVPMLSNKIDHYIEGEWSDYSASRGEDNGKYETLDIEFVSKSLFSKRQFNIITCPKYYLNVKME